MTLRGTLTFALLSLLFVPPLVALESGLAGDLRGLLEAQTDRHRFVIHCTGAFERSLRGERVRPRWKLDRHRLVDAESGELIYERYTADDGDAIAREGTSGKVGDWNDLSADTVLPEAFSLSRAVIEALLVTVAEPGDRAVRTEGTTTTLELDAFMTERIARTVLEGKAKLRFAGRAGTASVEEPQPDLWRIRCRLSGSLGGEPVELEVTLVVDAADGLLPYDDIPTQVAARLGLRVPRPGQFKATPRVLDHYTPERIETEFWVWFSDHMGGLAGEGALYQLQTRSMVWKDAEGRTLDPAFLGLEPDTLQGSRLRWRFDNLHRLGVTELHLELLLHLNFYPVTVRAAFARGGGVHANERAWMPLRPPETLVGALPDGIHELERR